MQVKNYYKMSNKKCVQSLDMIREWLFRNPNHEQVEKVSFALYVCLNALELKDDDDEFVQDIIDNLT